MATTWLQTVNVKVPITQQTFQSLELRPCPPEGYEHSKYPLRLKTALGVFTFYPDGCVHCKDCFGWDKFWLAKPRRYEPTDLALEMQELEFHKDDSVSANYYGVNYYWGDDLPGSAMTGELTVGTQCAEHGWCFEQSCLLENLLADMKFG